MEKSLKEIKDDLVEKSEGKIIIDRDMYNLYRKRQLISDIFIIIIIAFLFINCLN